MNLYLSTRLPWHATFATEDGQILYKVKTPIILGTRAAVITRVVPNDVPLDSEDADPDMKDKYAFMASIEFRVFSPDMIKLVGSEFTTKSYFRKEGNGFKLGPSYAFTGPDGREYKWVPMRKQTELILNDETKPPVARFHYKSGLIGETQPAWLEILPIGQHMVDMILVTSVWVEKKREDRRGGG